MLLTTIATSRGNGSSDLPLVHSHMTATADYKSCSCFYPPCSPFVQLERESTLVRLPITRRCSRLLQLSSSSPTTSPTTPLTSRFHPRPFLRASLMVLAHLVVLGISQPHQASLCHRRLSSNSSSQYRESPASAFLNSRTRSQHASSRQECSLCRWPR